MVWQRIDPRYLRQDDPDGLTCAYVDRGEHDSGHLVLHLDGQGTVIRFELVYGQFLSGRELYAAWDRTLGIQFGEVDSHGRTDEHRPRITMSPIVRHYRRVSPDDARAVLGYVVRNGGVLDGTHYDAVESVLRAACRLDDGPDVSSETDGS